MLQPTYIVIVSDPTTSSVTNTQPIPNVTSTISISTSTSSTTKQQNPLLSPTESSLDAPQSNIRSSIFVKAQEYFKTKWQNFKAAFLQKYPHERLSYTLFVVGFFIPLLPWFLGYWFYSPRLESKKSKKQPSAYTDLSQEPEEEYSDYVVYYGNRCREAFNVSSILWSIIVGVAILAAVVPSVFLAFTWSWEAQRLLANNSTLTS